MDGRYNQQKFRLTDSKLSHIFYLVEGMATKSSILPQSTIDSAILNTQLINKFKVKTTDTIHETLKWITQMNLLIENKFIQQIKDPENDTLEFKYNYTSFCSKTSKSHITIKTLFGNMLRNVKGCGKECVATILEKFPTPLSLYTALNSLPTEESRMDFLSPNKKLIKKKSSKWRTKLLLRLEQEYLQYANTSVLRLDLS